MRSDNHVSVCICTYQRPKLLGRLLAALETQHIDRPLTFSVVVVDNDSARSAENVVSDFAARAKVSITYCVEANRNIASARNKAVENAIGEFIAFIDDDEVPTPHWLSTLLNILRERNAAGVLGPVRPQFDQTPPEWLVRGRFCERAEYATGTTMHWRNCRTGNVLFRRHILKRDEAPFREEFGTGGEDVDFFKRMMARGHLFVWCNEAVVHETVPPSRWTRTYLLKRALLRGTNSWRIIHGRILPLARSAAAALTYTIVLPFALLIGQHCFMDYCIRLCDHLGLLLAACGINPIVRRPMS